MNKLNDSSVRFSSLKHNYTKLVIQNFIGYANTEFMSLLQSFHSLGVNRVVFFCVLFFSGNSVD